MADFLLPLDRPVFPESIPGWAWPTVWFAKAENQQFIINFYAFFNFNTGEGYMTEAVRLLTSTTGKVMILCFLCSCLFVRMKTEISVEGRNFACQ